VFVDHNTAYLYGMKDFVKKYKAEIRVGIIVFVVIVLSQIIHDLMK
jgi:hypothetical protein